MNLVDFWTCLPGKWLFERVISNDTGQTGVLKIEKVNPTLYQVFESGFYKGAESQTFFRNYRFCWEDDALKIFGENPKEGYVLLHTLNDTKRVHVHTCNKDFYEFDLQEAGEQNWRSVITITGPRKDLQLVTNYRR